MKVILLIEDDQIVATIYKNKFVSEGYHVETAQDGETGLALAKQLKPDVIVLDLMLPKMSGTEIMKAVRSEAGLEKVPIIVFSNTYLTTLVQEAWKAGATKCLSKANCTPRQLIDVVKGLTEETGKTVKTTAPTAVSASKAEGEDLESLQKKFISEFPATLTAMRAAHQGMVKADGDASRQANVAELYRKVHSVTSSAGVSGMGTVALMGDALEALLKELMEKPQSINVSTLRTVASGIDLLASLFQHASVTGVGGIPAAHALVVDDEPLSRRAVVKALEKAKLKSSEVDDSKKAYDMMLQNRYDLVFLDVDMPGMNGFELCTKLRSLPAYKKTPVVFVTGLTDFESRASSMMSGGNDFIGKPFLMIELAVKALVFILRSKLDPAAR